MPHADALVASRAVCTDDGSRIRLTLYSPATPARNMATDLTPLAALRLANELISSALRHIARGAAS
jgi:hypothetical protein